MNPEYTVKAVAGKKSLESTVIVAPLGEAAAAPGIGSRFAITIDGTTCNAEARRIDERGSVVSWSILLSDGRQRLIDVDGTLPDLKVSLTNGEPVQVKVDSKQDLVAGPTRSSSAAATGGELRAAMPGKVVKLLCRPGETVKAGQGLLVIEAMKMENELRAPADGTIATIAVREGQAVESGQSLLTLSTN
jgi:biotin carboxyl carrier protein